LTWVILYGAPPPFLTDPLPLRFPAEDLPSSFSLPHLSGLSSCDPPNSHNSFSACLRIAFFLSSRHPAHFAFFYSLAFQSLTTSFFSQISRSPASPTTSGRLGADVAWHDRPFLFFFCGRAYLPREVAPPRSSVLRLAHGRHRVRVFRCRSPFCPNLINSSPIDEPHSFSLSRSNQAEGGAHPPWASVQDLTIRCYRRAPLFLFFHS